ncbi:MAG: patatin family protein [bacterium]|nr:patatin family protein [bacterium]
MSKFVAIFFLILSLQGCTSGVNRLAVPVSLTDRAYITSMPHVRIWGDVLPKTLPKIMATKIAQTKAYYSVKNARKRLPAAHYLAISGGGNDGAFGAGLLNGWSDAGTRPEFEVVTGISTGALIAPFAFLGPSYDSKLKEVYTHYSSEDLVKSQLLAGLFGAEAIKDNHPLAKLIAHYINAPFLKAVATEHQKGRRLLIGTTNLDAQRPVIWDMGAIAQHGGAQALDLFRRIMLASASIPGVFPSVHLKVRAENVLYEEMHVDGGISNQVFLFPTQFLLKKFDRKYGIKRTRHLYIIRNGKLTPERQTTDANALSITERSLATIIKSQASGDLYKLYVIAKRNNIRYNLASIPETFKPQSKDIFDKPYMNALFGRGYQLGRSGYQWSRTPPGL